MLKTISMLGIATAALAISATSASAHCQMPCGIYDDQARVDQIREDILTIAKAVTAINQLSGKRDAQSNNQLVRWIVTKERHAEKIIHTVADYFLTQKIKPAPKGSKGFSAYVDELTKHHLVMVAAMKCKQTASEASVKSLAKAVDGIAGYWKR